MPFVRTEPSLPLLVAIQVIPEVVSVHVFKFRCKRAACQTTVPVFSMGWGQ
jgi:hypothetical protein